MAPNPGNAVRYWLAAFAFAAMIAAVVWAGWFAPWARRSREAPVVIARPK
jgi:hypothetical protein